MFAAGASMGTASSFSAGCSALFSAACGLAETDSEFVVAATASGGAASSLDTAFSRGSNSTRGEPDRSCCSRRRMPASSSASAAAKSTAKTSGVIARPAWSPARKLSSAWQNCSTAPMLADRAAPFRLWAVRKSALRHSAFSALLEAFSSARRLRLSEAMLSASSSRNIGSSFFSNRSRSMCFPFISRRAFSIVRQDR